MHNLTSRSPFVDNSALKKRLRLLIIAGTVLLPVVLIVLDLPLILLVGLMVFPIGFAALNHAMSDPTIGIIALIPINMYVQFAVSTGTETSISVTMLLLAFLGGTWVLSIAKLRFQYHLYHYKVTRALLIFIASASVGFMTGHVPWFRLAEQASLFAQLGGLSLYVFSALAFLIVANELRDRASLQRLVYLFFFCGAIYIIPYLLEGTEISAVLQEYVAHGSHGSMFWTWFVALLFAQAAWNRTLARPLRLTLIAVLLCTLFVLLVRIPNWLSGWIPACCAILTIILLIRPKLGVVLTLLIFAGLIWRANALFTVLQNNPENWYSYVTRVEAWKILIQIWLENPITGVGIGNYYFYTPLYNILGWHVRFNSHSQYIDFLTQIGLFGLITYAFFIYTLAKLVLALIPKVNNAFERAYLYGCAGGVAGTVVSGFLGDWIVPFIYNVGFPGFRASILAWLFMGGVVAIYRFNSTEPATLPSA